MILTLIQNLCHSGFLDTFSASYDNIGVLHTIYHMKKQIYANENHLTAHSEKNL